MNNKEFFIIITILILSIITVSSAPTGAGVTFISSSGPNQSQNASDSNITAIAGNLTEIIIDTDGGGSSSQTWQGFYGNVTGGLKLSDGSSNILYNWSSSAPQGEIFSSVNDSILWTNVQCFNFTAIGNFSDDSAQKGETSLYGLNASQANELYGIDNSDADSINATFNQLDHQEFFVNNLQFNANECPSAKMLNSTGQGDFEEILLYSPDNKNMIFASIINQNTPGFDGKNHDFQMIVPEDGHGADTNATAYYFYVEIG